MHIRSVLHGIAQQQELLGDPEVCIAMLDGPVDLSHPCFAGADLTRLDTLVQDPAGTGPMSVHGTHIASLLFGQPDSPVTGIAPRCRGLILPVFKDSQQWRVPQLDLARAIELAVQEGAHIINISGGERTSDGHAESMLERALRLCETNGVLVVAAVGNDGCDCLQTPAATSSVLAVGAAGPTGQPLESNNWGAAYGKNGVLAPGLDIEGAAPAGRQLALTGSSFATPAVSGVAALLITAQLRAGHHADPPAAGQAILHTATSPACSPDDSPECRRNLAGHLDAASAHHLVTQNTTTSPAPLPNPPHTPQPTTQPAPQLTAQAAPQPTTPLTAQAASQPAPQLTAQATTQPTTQPTVQAASQPTMPLTAQGTSQPTAQFTAQAAALHAGALSRGPGEHAAGTPSPLPMPPSVPNEGASAMPTPPTDTSEDADNAAATAGNAGTPPTPIAQPPRTLHPPPTHPAPPPPGTHPDHTPAPPHPAPEPDVSKGSNAMDIPSTAVTASGTTPGTTETPPTTTPITPAAPTTPIAPAAPAAAGEPMTPSAPLAPVAPVAPAVTPSAPVAAVAPAGPVAAVEPAAATAQNTPAQHAQAQVQQRPPAPDCGCAGVTASGCQCEENGNGGRRQLIYAIGTIGFDYQTEARRDFFRQQMPAVPGPKQDGKETENPPNIYDPRQLYTFLAKKPWMSEKLTWTLTLDSTAVYALEAETPMGMDWHQPLISNPKATPDQVGAAAKTTAGDSAQLAQILETLMYPPVSHVHRIFRDAILGQIQPPDDPNYVSRVSIPGELTGRTTRLYSGQVVPTVRVRATDQLATWNEAALVDAVVKAVKTVYTTKMPKASVKEATLRTTVRALLDKIYWQFRNLGQSSADRALNAAGTNAFLAGAQIQDGIMSAQHVPGSTGNFYTLDTITVTKSPYGRPGSDCHDVTLHFFDPEDDRRARVSYLFTFDVSDDPVSLGPVHHFIGS